MSAETLAVSMEAPAVYGKLPARGDFVTRRFGRPFVEAWDEWLRSAVLASRESLKEHWLDIYLTSPVWRFALAAGCCGPNTILGVVLPSVDKVGRYFPLTLGCELAPGIELTGLIVQAASWYRSVEALGLAALAPEFSIDVFEQPISLEIESAPEAPEAGAPLTAPGLHLPLRSARGAELRRAYQPLSQGRTLWWTSGSERVVPCLLICPGMPPSQAFTALLDGEWHRDGWLLPEDDKPEGMAEKTKEAEQVEKEEQPKPAAPAEAREGEAKTETVNPSPDDTASVPTRIDSAGGGI